jgi:hypothetical protein
VDLATWSRRSGSSGEGAGRLSGKAAKDKSRRLAGFKAPIRGLMGVLAGSGKAGAAAADDDDAPGEVAAAARGGAAEGKVEEEPLEQQPRMMAKDDALEQHRARRRQRGDEPVQADGAPAEQPLSPGIRGIRVWA